MDKARRHGLLDVYSIEEIFSDEIVVFLSNEDSIGDEQYLDVGEITKYLLKENYKIYIPTAASPSGKIIIDSLKARGIYPNENIITVHHVWEIPSHISNNYNTAGISTTHMIKQHINDLQIVILCPQKRQFNALSICYNSQ